MARAVPPWLWAVLLRDHGPRDATLRLCLLTLRTFMNGGGTAFPSQAAIAKAACVTEFTASKKLNRASELGWLGIHIAGHNGKGWKRFSYTACIPDHVEVPANHEQLAARWAVDGDVVTREDSQMVPNVVGDVSPALSGKGRTSPTSCGMVPNLSTEGPQPRADLVPNDVGSKSSFLSSQDKYSSKGALRTHSPFPITDQKPGKSITDEDLLIRIQKLSQVGDSSLDGVIRQLAGSYQGITPERIRQLLEANGKQHRGHP